VSLITPLIAEFGSAVLVIVLCYGASKVYGWRTTGLFVGGSIFWTTIVENLGVMEGAYNYTAYAGSLSPSYRGYLLWVGLVPLWVELGWIIVALSLFMLLREVLLPRQGPLVRALVVGLLAVNIDAMIDPIAVANRLWVWLGPSYYVLGVPFYNWMGWFLLVFFYTFTFECTILKRTDMLIFGKLDRKLFGKAWGSWKVVEPFSVRLLVVNLLVVILLTVVSVTVVPGVA
jgi:bisanhydrobacterioruberin hydratase